MTECADYTVEKGIKFTISILRVIYNQSSYGATDYFNYLLGFELYQKRRAYPFAVTLLIFGARNTTQEKEAISTVLCTYIYIIVTTDFPSCSLTQEVSP